MGGHEAGRASCGDRGAGTVDVEEVRDAIGNHLLARPEQVVLWILHEVPYYGVPVVAHCRADVARRLGARNILQAEVGILERLIRYLHRYPLFGIQGNGLSGCDIEKGRIVDIRVLFEEMSALGGNDVGAGCVGVVEGVRVPSARRWRVSIYQRVSASSLPVLDDSLFTPSLLQQVPELGRCASVAGETACYTHDRDGYIVDRLCRRHVENPLDCNGVVERTPS